MKILFITLASFSDFPSYKRATGTGSGLANLGIDVYVALKDCEENRERFPREAPNCTPIWINDKNVLCEIFQKIFVVWKLRPEYIFLGSYSPRNLAFCKALLPWGTKVIVEFCELYSAWGEHPIGWKIREFLAIFEANRILCASKYLANVFRNRVATLHRNIPIIYMPYAYPEYLRPQNKKDNLHRHIVVLMSIGVRYGSLRYLEVMLELAREHKGLVIDQIGGGDVAAAKEWVTQHECSDIIKVHGFVAESDLNRFFSEADVFFAPLHDTIQDWARCPSKIFYYLPYNKPIVTCKIGDPIDILGEDYQFYYECEDMKDLKRVFEKALVENKPPFKTGFENSHTWAARAKKFLEWLND